MADDFDDGGFDEPLQQPINLAERKRHKWHKLYLRNKNGAPYSNAANVMVALENDPMLRGIVAYDKMLLAPVVCHEIGAAMDLREPRPATDGDAVAVMIYLQQQELTALKIGDTRSALDHIANRRAFHPVRDYLENLEWDGVPRIGVWLASYLGAELNQYTQHIGRMFMIQMCARIFAPGCQADHMLVLEGQQGILKSTACKVLGGAWFSDHLPPISKDKACSEHIKGKWLVEITELNAMKRAEATELKSFLSRTDERYRPTWGHREAFQPRQCCFVGTTNELQYLKDPSGGRRFWPVRVGVTGDIQIELLEENRDQLFAEATDHYRHGVQWWPDKQFEVELIKPEQAARLEVDVWREKIEEYVGGRTSASVADILGHLGLVTKEQHQLNAMRVVAVLRDLGWEPERSKRQRFWVAPDRML